MSYLNIVSIQVNYHKEPFDNDDVLTCFVDQ